MLSSQRTKIKQGVKALNNGFCDRFTRDYKDSVVCQNVNFHNATFIVSASSIGEMEYPVFYVCVKFNYMHPNHKIIGNGIEEVYPMQVIKALLELEKCEKRPVYPN